MTKKNILLVNEQTNLTHGPRDRGHLLGRFYTYPSSCSCDVAVDIGGCGNVVVLTAICCGVVVIVSAAVPFIIVVL